MPYTQELIATLDATAAHPDFANGGRSRRTKMVLDSLGQLGESKGCSVWSHLHQQEWLYDMVWLTQESREKPPREVNLVLECEWDTNETIIGDDFQKLLVARTNMRVFIFASGSGHTEAAIERLRQQIRDFRQNSQGDLYFFACYNEKEKRFAHLEYRAPVASQ